MSQHNFIVVGADTDGVAFKKPDQKPFTAEERAFLLNEINSEMDELIRWEDDGVFKRQIVVKAKNYVLQDESGKVKIKGSGLKATTKEKALQTFIKELIDLLLKDRKDQVFFLYIKYTKEILNIQDISQWCMKKTITKAVLHPERTQEQRVLDALDGMDINEGDKVYLFNKTQDDLCVQEKFDGTYDVETLLSKLYDTLSVFETVLDIETFPDFSLKRNQKLLALISEQDIPTVVPKRNDISGALPALAFHPFFQTRNT